MFIHSEHIRSELFSWELTQEANLSRKLSQEAGFSYGDRFSSLLNREAIKDTKSQMLFLLTIVSREDLTQFVLLFFFFQASALVHMHDNNDIKLLYQFLSKASIIYHEVYPLM